MKTLFTGFAPNVTGKDVLYSLFYLLNPFFWSSYKNGRALEKAEVKIADLVKSKHAIVCDSGRSAIQIGLEALGIKKGDKVLVQAFTCIVVINAIRKAGGIPVYVDCNETYTMDLNDVKKKYTEDCTHIIIQHTFGVIADLEALCQFAKEKNIKVIEDAAQVFHVDYKGMQVGIIGDIGVYSFGTDKPMSCVRGGAIVTNDDFLAEKVRSQIKTLPSQPVWNIVQYLLQAPCFFIGKKTYSLGIGKIFLYGLKKFKVLPRIIEQEEKTGKLKQIHPMKLPNVLAKLLLLQLQRIESYNEQRRYIASIYDKEIQNEKVEKPAVGLDTALLRYPLIVKNASKLREQAKEQGVLLGDWYTKIAGPGDVKEDAMHYTGSCPTAERLADQTVNLPTDIWISTKDAKRIVGLINRYDG